MKNEEGVYIGTIGINAMEFCDPMGIIQRKVPLKNLFNRTDQEVKDIIQSSLSNEHPVIILPNDWGEKSHLEMSYSLIRKSTLIDKKYPRYYISGLEEQTIERMVQIPIDDQINLLLCVAICTGKLEKSITWRQIYGNKSHEGK